MVALRTFRVTLVTLLVLGLGAAALMGYRLFTEKPDHDPPVSRVKGTTADGWQQITYQGVDAEVPPTWQRLDMTRCANDFERWGSPDQDPCDLGAGLTFLAAATYDPATGPGVHQARPSTDRPEGGWEGYVTRGDVVVDVADADQAVVRRILQSVTEPL